MPFIFYIFALLLIYSSLKSLRGGINYLNYFRKELARPISAFTPFATVIVPCKGVDEGLEANLSSLFELDYPGYEVVFVVDDENDQAVRVINKIVSRKAATTQSDGTVGHAGIESPLTPSSQLFASSRLCGKIPVRIVVAPKSGDSSQKVENIREAVLHADERCEVFVFVDTDARPASNWLRHLVAPLDDEQTGVATGYRWFLSEKTSFASELRSAWNASIASALGPNTKSNFCWGGSMSIRRDRFEKLDIRERLKGTLSDDFTVTRAMREAGLDIRFVPQALTPSTDSCTFGAMLEFTTRQMKITRVYATPLWLMSFFGSGLFTFLMLAAFLIVIFSEKNDLLVWSAITMLAIVTVCSIGKAWLRLEAVKLVIPEASRQKWTQLTLWLITPAVFLYNCIYASFSRRMTWRGVKYELVSEKQTRLIG